MTATRAPRGLVLGTVLTAMFMAILDVFIVNVANPAIQRDLHAPASAIQWIVAGYVLAYAVMLITGGRIGDAIGRRRAFRAGMGLFTLASAACSAAPTSATLIAARVVQGLGAALMQPQVLSIIQVEFSPQERPRAFALLGSVIGVASVAGQIVGGALIALAGWRAVFAINVPIGVVTIVLAGRVLPESKAAEARRLDVVGVALGTLALLLVVAPVVEGREAGWPLWVPVAIAAALPVGALFLRHERRLSARGAAPLVDLSLFAVRPFVTGIGIVLAFWGAVPVYFVGLAQYLQRGEGLSPVLSGVVFTPLAAAFFATSLAAPRIAPRVGGPQRVMTLGALVTALGAFATSGALVLNQSDAHLPTVPLVLGLALMGAGQGLLMPGAIAFVLRDVPVASAGSASGLLATTQQTAAVLGIALGGTLFFGLAGDPPTPGGFSDALAALGLWTAGGALIAAGLTLWRPSAIRQVHANSHALTPSGR
ncbi:Multidrug resistance protein Stp [Baekduia alba]|uniref:MFS transporter n=1 Tax=Baekduia alba TaxID=2997333 RepID=UPI002340FD0A|nr:MFS transporter [Baekduia alba]WCB92540.1 Multidrug resistance protein Stp [Baekduia alba]